MSSLDEIAAEVKGERVEKEEPIPGAKEYVKINGVWQHTNMAWFVDKEKMNSPFTTMPSQQFLPNQSFTHSINMPHQSFTHSINIPHQNYMCVAHVHHWKTALEEYCRVDENWKCVRCADEVPDAIQSMIKLYRPLKDV